MLYDPKWAPTKTDVHALPTLIAWLEKQPANMDYPYRDCRGLCLLGQYWLAHGHPWREGIYGEMQQPTGGEWGIKIAAPGPHTFGAALVRARQFLADAE